ncbi:MAG: VOC family protein [Candidatus Margulisiibacteriota bacterium]
MTDLHHVGITCSDIRRSERFYIDNFGLENVQEMDVPAEIAKKIFGIDSPARIIFLKAENSIIELFDFPEAKLKPTMGTISHIALSVASPKEAFDKMNGKGIEVVLIDKGNGKYNYFVKDPDGVLIELK